MDVNSLSKLTVPQLKKELKERGLPLAGVKADLVARLSSFYNNPSPSTHSTSSMSHMSPHHGIDASHLHQLQQIPHQLHQQIQQLQMLPQEANYTLNNHNSLSLSSLPPFPTTNTASGKTTTKTFAEVMLGLVDPRDKFGGVVSTLGYGEDDVMEHEGLEWAFYCTKSMDYQVWATVYFKILKKRNQKRGMNDYSPIVEALVEFPSGKKVKGILNAQNGHRLVVIKEANLTTLTKTFGSNNKETINNIKVTLRTIADTDPRKADTPEPKKQKVETEKEEAYADWGVYGQMDSDDENRSEYESSDYSSDDESDDTG